MDQPYEDEDGNLAVIICEPSHSQPTQKLQNYKNCAFE